MGLFDETDEKVLHTIYYKEVQVGYKLFCPALYISLFCWFLRWSNQK